MRKIWPFTFNVFIYAGFAFVAPFFVLYYQSLGFTGAQIGLLAGITPLITMVGAPLWTALADATRRHRLVMSLALLVGAVSISAFPFLSAFVPVLLVAILFNAFFAPVTSLADSATMYMLADQKEMNGRIRLGGTIGFGVAAYLAGVLVQAYSLNVVFWGCALLFVLAFFTSQKFAYNPQGSAGSPLHGIRILLTNLRWLLFLLLAFVGGLALAGANTYLFPYMAELGASESTMGTALTLGTLSEIPVLFYGHLLLKRFKPYGLLILAMILTGVRLLAFAIATTPTQVLFVQLLNGLTFPAMWIAGVAYADQNAPAGLSSTAQGMFGAMVFGFGTAVGGFIGGLLLESVGGRGIYLVFGTIVLVTVAAVALLYRTLPKKTGRCLSRRDLIIRVSIFAEFLCQKSADYQL